MDSDHLIRRLVIILVIIISLGTTGYIIFGYDLWHAFYTTVIILLSHFKHGVEDSMAEQILDILLIIGSYFILAYIIRGAADYLYGGAFKEDRRRKKMIKKISKLKDHYIVCGYGRVGKQVAQEMAYEEVEFVVIDKNPKVLKEAADKGFNTIEGDPIKESILVKAGVQDAKALISSLGEDTDNLFLTLTARSLNPNIFIVARASSKENVSKIKKAGADKVSMPYQIGGYHMAGIALRPAVVDFLDVISDGRHAELQIEEINVARGSRLIGQNVAEELSRKKAGVTVLAINKANGTTKINPSGDEIIERDDQLILMGTRERLEELSKELND